MCEDGMASKANENGEDTEGRDETPDGALGDKTTAAVKRMMARAKERGYVTYDELNAALPPDEVSSEQIEDTMAMLSDMGINVVEDYEAGEEQEAEGDSDEEASELAEQTGTATPPPARCS
jgi:RNA polymerase primary sigma factor